ncbi:hypothetical protein [Kribbella flavida]|uniref:hypothetical protein n=1 Tax=Kribbella flavida TaxID=182640 RepID=UPI0013050AA3|nr:hypothetical protein [Kribbella flavida]
MAAAERPPDKAGLGRRPRDSELLHPQGIEDDEGGISTNQDQRQRTGTCGEQLPSDVR